uniref:PQ-loop repeat-containing protein n=1 Tax=viral metagenome TaxID=1070528 RepID=A0A6C0D613_9ZZZZ
MNTVYLSIISSAFIVIGYFPEIYLTIFQIKNVDSTRYSSILWLVGGTLGTVYSGINNVDTFILINYSVNTSLNLVTLILKLYYDYKNNESPFAEKKTINASE